MTEPDVYRAQLDTVFRVEGQPPVEIRLVEIANEKIQGDYLDFALIFHGPSDRLLPQGTYTFQHDALGELMMFIVPIAGSNRQRIVYEACFSIRRGMDA